MTGYLIESRSTDGRWYHGKTVYSTRQDAEVVCGLMRRFGDGWEQKITEMNVLEPGTMGSTASVPVSAYETRTDTDNGFEVPDAS